MLSLHAACQEVDMVDGKVDRFTSELAKLGGCLTYA